MKRIQIPLIIDGKDILLPNDELVFVPHSLISDAPVIAQGANVAICHQAIDSSQAAFKMWSQTAPSVRRRLLLKLAGILREKENEAMQIIMEEIHASELWAAINIEDSISLIEEAAALMTSPSLAGSIAPTRDLDSQGLIFTEPLGVILGIAPWNAPLILGFRAVVAPLAAGNTAILKGSELSPRTHYFVASLFREAGFPPGVCNFLLHRDLDAAEIFETLIEREEVRKCNFTGSTQVGRAIASRAARALKPCLLELGGKNYVLVLQDADVEKAASMVAEGAFLNNGQICMSTDTVLIMAPVFDAFRKALFAIIDSPDRCPPTTAIITEKSKNRIHALLQDAKSKGALVHVAGSFDASSTQPTGRSIPPTVIEGITKDMSLFSEESFGPLVSIKSIENVEEAVRLVQACRYGLSMAIHTRSHYEALSVARKLDVGAVHINGSTVHDESTLPHGGCRDSGWGRFGSSWGLQEFLQTKTVILNRQHNMICA